MRTAVKLMMGCSYDAEPYGKEGRQSDGMRGKREGWEWICTLSGGCNGFMMPVLKDLHQKRCLKPFGRCPKSHKEPKMTYLTSLFIFIFFFFVSSLFFSFFFMNGNTERAQRAHDCFYSFMFVPIFIYSQWREITMILTFRLVMTTKLANRVRIFEMSARKQEHFSFYPPGHRHSQFTTENSAWRNQKHKH